MPPKLLRKSRPADTVEEAGPNSSTKQRLIDAAKMILDIVKESADICPPLKSCLGGISALMKLCEDSKDVEEKLGDLIPWVLKLKESVPAASADGDPEGAKRDEQLILELNEIGRQSEALAKKGVEARLADHKQDSGKVVKLVERLRQALLIYQFLQQQAMYNQVKKLAFSLETFSKSREPKVAVKIDSAIARLGRLSVEGGTLCKGASKQSLILFEALEGIKDELQSISEQSSVVGYQENPEDVYAVCELVESVKDAVLKYQLAQQDMICKQNLKLIKSGELDVLNNSHRARGAEYRHGNRSCCLKGTRERVLNHIEGWTEDFDKPPVYWLNGLAGTGKSTIAQTIAEWTFASGCLGASFFCSRNVADRSNLQLIFPTLAFQLAHNFPAF